MSLKSRQLHASEQSMRWVRVLQDIIQIPSTFEHEHDLLQYLETLINKLGAEVHRIPFDAKALRENPRANPPFSEVLDRHNLVVKVPGNDSGPSLILSSHLDVVPAGDAARWTYPPYAGHIDADAGIVYGRGAMDDKAGVVIALAVLDRLLSRTQALAGDVLFHFVLEDEITGNGTLLCLTAGYGADAAMIIDGTRLDKAIDKHAGQFAFEIVVHGSPASVVVSHMGVNAAEVLAEVILELREHIFDLNTQRQAPWDQFPSPYQVSVQAMHSASGQLTLPTLATATCYATFPPTHSLAQVKQIIEDIVSRACEKRRASATVKGAGISIEPVSSDTVILEQVLQDSAAAVGLNKISVGPSTGTSDLRHFAHAQIPCLLYGPGRGYNPHRFDEHYLLEDLDTMIRFYQEMVERWTGERR